MDKKSVAKNYRFLAILLSCMIAGALVGWFAPDFGHSIAFLGTVFINMMFCVVVPLVFASIAGSVANMESRQRAGKIMGVTVGTFVITGAIVYLAKPEAATGESLMAWHVGLGIVFTLNLVGYLLFAPERFALMINACLIWDKNTILWFRNFGGYPRRFFKIPFGPVEVTPQGRYNAGQKASYLLFTAAIVMLIVTGWLLWVFAPAIGKDAFLTMWYLHVWGSLLITVLVVCAHIPLALLSMSHFLGIWRIGTGDISWEAAEHHSPVWLEKDVIRTNIEK